MKISNEREMSTWIWNQLIRKKVIDEDMKKMAKEYVITLRGSKEAYLYCSLIEDDHEVRKHITESHWAYMYCTNIKDIEEMWEKITDPIDAFYYNLEVKPRKEISKISNKIWPGFF